MDSTLSDLDERLTDVEKAVTSAGRAELKNNIIDALPEIHSDEGPTGKSVEEIAEEIQEDRDRVDDVITQLAEETGIVSHVESIDGQMFYAREGGV
jgi:hypothetical protein